MSDNKKNQNDKPESTYSTSDLQTTVMTAVAAALQATQPQRPSQESIDAMLREKILGGSACGECRQLRKACKGKHKQMVVWPSNPAHEDFFDGVRINGVRYCSPNGTTPITVPAKADIRALLSANSWLEESYRRSRKHKGKGGALAG